MESSQSPPGGTQIIPRSCGVDQTMGKNASRKSPSSFGSTLDAARRGGGGPYSVSEQNYHKTSPLNRK